DFHLSSIDTDQDTCSSQDDSDPDDENCSLWSSAPSPVVTDELSSMRPSELRRHHEQQRSSPLATSSQSVQLPEHTLPSETRIQCSATPGLDSTAIMQPIPASTTQPWSTQSSLEAAAKLDTTADTTMDTSSFTTAVAVTAGQEASSVAQAPTVAELLQRIYPTERTLTRTKSYSALERGYRSLSSSVDLGKRRPASDWVPLSTVQALGAQIEYVSRTNQFLNQEVGRLNSQLEEHKQQQQQMTVVSGYSTEAALSPPWTWATNSLDKQHEGRTWQREYEFMVQQLDQMHQQLQFAQCEHSSSSSSSSSKPSLISDSSELVGGEDSLQVVHSKDSTTTAVAVQQLNAEVKELTASLRRWQEACHRAEAQYRRKCEGERALKQTLRERETQLSRLSGQFRGDEMVEQGILENEASNIASMTTTSTTTSTSTTTTTTTTTTTSLMSGLATNVDDGSGNYNHQYHHSLEDGTGIKNHSRVPEEVTEERTSRRMRITSQEEEEVAVAAATAAIAAARAVKKGARMPGTFPDEDQLQLSSTTAHLDEPESLERIVTSIISWTAVLAASMLS
ncbi:hypothetical protein BGW38_006718, partial [Lunasporangiospora selenospora]